MIKVDHSLIIACPIAAVFAFVADQTNDPRWQSGVLDVRRTTAAPPGIGTKHRCVRKFMGRRWEANTEYVEYEPNQRVSRKSTSGFMAFAAGYVTEAAEGGTQLTAWIELQPQDVAGLSEPFIAESLSRDVEASLIELKELLERRIVTTS
jgi:uncharacterized protein YndB with AHSA1/START domain